MTLALLANRSLHRRWPGGWSPKELGTLSAWWDADDATTVTISTGVSQWDDKSGNGYNFTQATGANQPSWVKGTQAGRAVVRFDGTNGQMSAGDGLDLRTGGISIVGAFKTNSNTYLLTKTHSTNTALRQWEFNPNACYVYLGGTAVLSYLSIANTTKMFSYVVDRSNGATLWRDGTQIDSDTGSPFPNTTDIDTATDVQLGGRNGTTSNRFNGDVYEIVVSMSVLSTGDRQKCEGYLSHKWGLTGNLPNDHPYKSIAP